MRRKAGWLLAGVLIALVSVLGKAGYTAISAQIRDFKQMMPGGMLMAPGGLPKAPDGLLKALGGSQEAPGEALEQKAAAAQEEAKRQEAIAAMRKRRDKAESERRLSGDPTPRVEAIIATADNRLCALIDDALVYEGGTVQGYCIRKIHADSVQFEKGGKVWVQKMQ